VTAHLASQELHDLAFRYALAVDTLNIDLLASLFVDGGAVRGFGENPIVFEGRDGLARMISQVDAAFQKTMHNVFNQTFDVNENGEITGQTTCVASHILRGEGWTLLDMAMRYHNRYTQVDGIWKFSERRLEVVWVETRPVQKFTAAMMDSDLKEFR
jgi:SnoaL-like domain